MNVRAKRELFRAGSIGLAALLAGLACLASGCGGRGYSGPERAIKNLTRIDYGKPYIGMSKQQILNCAGQPRARIPAAGGETFIYHYKGVGPVPGGTPKDATCTASLTFDETKLVRVNYSHKEGRSPYAWQSEKDPEKRAQMKREEPPTCVFTLPRCSG